jgi:phage gpG-like protein
MAEPIKITAQIIGVEAVIAKLNLLGFGAQERVEAEVKRLGLELLRKVKEEKLSGQVLNVRTGSLRRSINMKSVVDRNQITATIGTNKNYAAIHEFGGQTREHEILPRNAKALLFEANGRTTVGVKTQTGRYAKSKAKLISAAIADGSLIFSRGVHHPGSKLPMRSFLRSALDEMRGEIQRRLLAAVMGGAK